MKLTRKGFLNLFASVAAAAAAGKALSACSGDDNGDDPNTSTASSSGSSSSSDTTSTGTGGGGQGGKGGSGQGGKGGGGGSCDNGATASDISANHGHTLAVPAGDIQAATEKTYDIQGSSGHPHSITLTAADFATLAKGTEVIVVSSEDAGHTHNVTVKCS